jgi:hypothetical protein
MLPQQRELQNKFRAKIYGAGAGFLLLIGLWVDFWLLFLLAGLLAAMAIYIWSDYWKE